VRTVERPASTCNTLGRLAWFAVAGTADYDEHNLRQVVPVTADYTEVLKWFEELGLNDAFLPPRIREVDSFRKATSAINTEYVLNEEEGLRASLHVTDESTDTDWVNRNLMREVRNRQKQHVSSQKVAELSFYRGKRKGRTRELGTAEFNYRIRRNISPTERDVIVGEIESALAAYQLMSSRLSNTAIRGVLRTYLLSLHGVPMHSSGGLYFVPDEFASEVFNLQELVRRLGGGATFGEVEVHDTAERREMINEAIESMVVSNVRELLRELTAALAGEVSLMTYAGFARRYQQISDLSEYYAKLLSLPQERAADALESALEPLASALSRSNASR